jgi:hypothetical protein
VFGLALAFTWDIGFYLIILSLLNILSVSLDIFQAFTKKLLPIFGWVVLLLLLAGYGTGIAANEALAASIPFSLDLQLFDSSYYLLGLAVVLETLAVTIAFVGFIAVAGRRRPGAKMANPRIFLVTVAALASLLFLIPRIVSDQLRMWNYHYPSFAEMVGAGLVPEAAFLLIWMVTVWRVGRWVKDYVLVTLQLQVRCQQAWDEMAKAAYDVVLPDKAETASAVLTKLEDVVSRADLGTVSGVLLSSTATWLRILLTSSDSVVKKKVRLDNDRLHHAGVSAAMEIFRDNMKKALQIISESITYKLCEDSLLLSRGITEIDDEATLDAMEKAFQQDEDNTWLLLPGKSAGDRRSRLVFLIDVQRILIEILRERIAARSAV